LLNKVIGLDSLDIKKISEFFGVKATQTFYPQREERLF